MKTGLVILPVLTCILVACPAKPAVPTLGVKPNVKVLAAASVDKADAAQIDVSVPGITTGDVIVSEFQDADDDGLLRKVTSISSTQTTGVGPLAITKVYVKTEAASLEDVFDTGVADINFGGLNFADPNAVTTTAAGVRVQAVTGDIPLRNFKIPLGSVGDVTFNGSISQNFDPTFKLTFDKGRVDQFEIGLSGKISAILKAKLSTTAKLTSQTFERTIASSSIRRVFLVGVVPVIVVIEPRMVIGFTGGADQKVTVEASIAPSFDGAFKVSYNAKLAKKWVTSWTTPKFALNPNFSYTVPSAGNGDAYTKLVMDVKFYGIAGPTLETKPYLNLKLDPSGTATTKAGLAASGLIQAGINVLGKSMTIATDPLTQEASQSYSCVAGGACK